MKIYKTLIDVRAPWEYEEGHVPGSINIPLDEIQNKLEEIRKMPAPILVCCMSGNRSTVATNFLKDNEVNCDNGEGWQNVASAIENQKICLEK